MGIVLGDLSKPIREQDMPFFQKTIHYVEYFNHKHEQYETEIIFVHEIRQDVLALIEDAINGDAHILLADELAHERQQTMQKANQAKMLAHLFQDAITRKLTKDYKIPTNQLQEWNIDLTKRLLYRTPPVTERLIRKENTAGDKP
jgi:hypothetical protein